MSVNPKICATLALYFWWGVISAQSYLQRVAVVDMNYITSSLPQYKHAERYISEREAEWQSEITALYDAADSLKKDIRIRRAILPDDMIAVMEEEKDGKIRMADSLKAVYFGPQGRYEEEKKRTMEPIIRAIRSEIEQYAQKNKISVVLDKTEMTVLYVDKISDISTVILNRIEKNYKKE